MSCDIHVMKIMGGSGHTDLEWRTDDPESVTVAKRQFKTFVKDHHAPAFETLVRGGDAVQVTTFNPEAEEVLIAVPVAGGCVVPALA